MTDPGPLTITAGTITSAQITAGTITSNSITLSAEWRYAIAAEYMVTWRPAPIPFEVVIHAE